MCEKEPPQGDMDEGRSVLYDIGRGYALARIDPLATGEFENTVAKLIRMHAGYVDDGSQTWKKKPVDDGTLVDRVLGLFLSFEQGYTGGCSRMKFEDQICYCAETMGATYANCDCEMLEQSDVMANHVLPEIRKLCGFVDGGAGTYTLGGHDEYNLMDCAIEAFWDGYWKEHNRCTGGIEEEPAGDENPCFGCTDNCGTCPLYIQQCEREDHSGEDLSHARRSDY